MCLIVVDTHRFEVPAAEKTWARLEQVYLGVALLRYHFPDVSFVSEKVLTLFHMIDPDVEVRKLERFVKSFVNIQYATVQPENAVLAEPEKLAETLEKQLRELGLTIDADEWSRSDRGSLVTIGERANGK